MRWEAHKAAEPEVAAALQRYVDAGVLAASKALRRSTRSINRIAAEHGFEFSTCTARTMESRRKARASLVTQVKALADSGAHQAEICSALSITRAELREIAEINHINIDNRTKGPAPAFFAKPAQQ
jgi:predicted XRE-type DNA-binding protein